MQSFFDTLWSLTTEMAPYLLLGFFIAGVLKAFVPQNVYRRHLSKPGFRSVLNATMLGVPLPLCSCGVIPTTVALRRAGASRGACTAFLIATPQTGVDSILATYSLLGLPFAVLRPVAALVTGLLGGWMTDVTLRGDNQTATAVRGEEAKSAVSLAERVKLCLTYGFGELMEDVGRWLVVGLVVAALITEYVPNDFFVVLQDYKLLNMLLVLLVAIPMYLCATGSIPIALSLLAKGLTPGAALVMLMAGPAVNAASLLVVGKALGRRQMAAYLSSIIGGAMAFGLIVDYVLPMEWFDYRAASASVCCHGATATPWHTAVLTTVFLLLLCRALTARYIGHSHHEHTHEAQAAVITLQVTGMRCSHCAENARQAVMGVAGVESVDVDLPSGRVVAQGAQMERAQVVEAIQRAGYSVVNP